MILENKGQAQNINPLETESIGKLIVKYSLPVPGRQTVF